MKKKLNKYFKYSAIIGMLVTLTCCNQGSPYIKTEGMIWNTVYHITYKGPQHLKDSIMPILNEVGKSLSVFDKNSLVTQLNNSISVCPDSHLIKVYDTSKRISRSSHGNFDPTVAPLIDAWGFGIGHVPTKDTLELDSVLIFIGIEKTHREDSIIFKEDIRTKFNFSAIAKGYGCDEIGEMLRRNGVKDFMIEIGGEITLGGKSPSGGPWKIAIDKPVEGNNPGEETIVILNLTDCGIATSGNYRNYRMEGSEKIAHTISPITGRPIISDILSVSVISSTCMEADAIATACMAGSINEAKELLNETKSEGLIITTDSIFETPGFSRFILEAWEPGRRDRN